MVSLPARQAGSEASRFADVDASELTEGQVYRLCVDLDGISPGSPTGDTGFNAFVTPVSKVITRAVLRASSQLLYFVCATCTPGARVSLASNCTWKPGSGSRTALAPLMQEVPARERDTWRAVLDASKLLLDIIYKLCLTMENALPSLGEGEVGDLPVMPVTALVPGAVRKHQSQQLWIRCDEGCTPASLLHFSVSRSDLPPPASRVGGTAAVVLAAAISSTVNSGASSTSTRHLLGAIHGMINASIDLDPKRQKRARQQQTLLSLAMCPTQIPAGLLARKR